MPPHGGGADAAAEAEDGDGIALHLLLPLGFLLPGFELGLPLQRVVYGGEVGDFDLVVQEEVCQPPGLHVFVEAVGAGGAGDFVVGFLFLAHGMFIWFAVSLAWGRRRCVGWRLRWKLFCRGAWWQILILEIEWHEDPGWDWGFVCDVGVNLRNAE